jgi:hypothetical protein
LSKRGKSEMITLFREEYRKNSGVYAGLGGKADR